jgi:hypothetical protein
MIELGKREIIESGSMLYLPGFLSLFLATISEDKKYRQL